MGPYTQGATALAHKELVDTQSGRRRGGLRELPRSGRGGPTFQPRLHRRDGVLTYASAHT